MCLSGMIHQSPQQLLKVMAHSSATGQRIGLKCGQLSLGACDNAGHMLQAVLTGISSFPFDPVLPTLGVKTCPSPDISLLN